MSEQPRFKQITYISVRNIALNLALAAVKIAAGGLAGSLAVLSDGLNSLSDVATTLVVLIGNRFTDKAYDDEHQYGHEKIESLITFTIALAMIAGALFTGYESVLRLLRRQTPDPSWLALAAVGVSALVKAYMFKTTKKVASLVNSDMLTLVAVDFKFDIFLSGAVFFGVLLTMLGLWFFEPVAAIIASAILLKSAAAFIARAFNQLVDRSAGKQTLKLIRETALSCDNVLSVDLLKTRLHGNMMYVDIEISVDPNISVYEGHRIAQSVHDRLESMSGCGIKHCMVHVNPGAADLG